MSRVPLFLLFLVLPGIVLAQSHPGENVTYGYAQVLRATPVYQTVRVRVPETRCEGAGHVDGRDSAAGGTLVGAVLGGALGNQVGKGDGRKASTLAGAVVGGAVGRRVAVNDSSLAGPGRCRTVEVERNERRLAGYDVEYQYKGETYMSRLAGDPGNRLRIRVSVTPDEPTLGSR
jgi:uncharacterized protein YcfJ